jgi:hypothetical protein
VLDIKLKPPTFLAELTFLKTATGSKKVRTCTACFQKKLILKIHNHQKTTPNKLLQSSTRINPV